MTANTILEGEKFLAVLKRLAYQIIEETGDLTNTVLIGIQPRGIELAKKIHNILEYELKIDHIPFGTLDPTFFRDDLHFNNVIRANKSNLDIEIENKRVILMDDVLYTGRTARAAIESLLSYGRPRKIELLVLVNRRFSRDIPIKSDYIGISVDTIASQKVRVTVAESEYKVTLL